MPRVENQGSDVDAWVSTANQNPTAHQDRTTHDLCRACYALLIPDPQALNAFLSPLQTSLVAGPEPRGADGWGGDLEHQTYAELQSPVGGPVECAACGVPLTEEDDRA